MIDKNKVIIAIVTFTVIVFFSLYLASGDSYTFGNTIAALVLLSPFYAYFAVKIIIKLEENTSPIKKYEGLEDIVKGKPWKEMTKKEKFEWIKDKQAWLEKFNKEEEKRRNKKKFLW